MSMDKSQSPVAVIDAAEQLLNQSPLSSYGLQEPYQKCELYRNRCSYCGKLETGTQPFKTCSRCIDIGVKHWEPLFQLYCSRECQKARWTKHRNEHYLYQAKKRSSFNDIVDDQGDTDHQQSTELPTMVSKGIHCDMSADSKKSDGTILLPSSRTWELLSRSSSAPSNDINHYMSRNTRDRSTDTSTLQKSIDAAKKNRKKATKESRAMSKGEDLSSLSSDNITVIDVNEFPPLDDNFFYESPDTSSGSDAGGSNMYIFMGADGKKSAILKKKKKKDKNNFNPRVLFEKERLMGRLQKPEAMAPKIKELSVDEIDSLAAKCNPNYRANLKKKDKPEKISKTAAMKKDMELNVPRQKLAKTSTNSKKETSTKSSAKSSQAKLNSSTKEREPTKTNPNDVATNSSNNKPKGHSKKQKPYTDSDMLAITKPHSKSLSSDSCSKRQSLAHRDGGAVISEVRQSLDSTKSMEILKRKLDELLSDHIRPQRHKPKDESENFMLKVVDEYLSLSSPGKVTGDPQQKSNTSCSKSDSAVSVHAKPTGQTAQIVQDDRSIVSPLSDDDYHDAHTDLKKESPTTGNVSSDKCNSSKGSHSSPLMNELPKKSANHGVDSECKEMTPTEGSVASLDLQPGDESRKNSVEQINAPNEDERMQKIVSHVNRKTYEKVKKPGDPDDLDSFYRKHSEKTTMSQTHEIAFDRFGNAIDLREYESTKFVYVEPPLVHCNYARRVDQYNGANPNDPFLAFNNSRSFVVQKSSKEPEVSYIGLLISEKPDTVITTKYILLKNAAYDGRNIELGVKREVIDMNEAGEPLYDDFLIRKIPLKRDDLENPSADIAEDRSKTSTTNISTNSLPFFTGIETNTFLTSPIVSSGDEAQVTSELFGEVYAKSPRATGTDLKGSGNSQVCTPNKEMTDATMCEKSLGKNSSKVTKQFLSIIVKAGWFPYIIRKDENFFFLIKRWMDYYY